MWCVYSKHTNWFVPARGAYADADVDVDGGVDADVAVEAGGLA